MAVIRHNRGASRYDYFLGIGEGRRKLAKAEAEAKVLEAKAKLADATRAVDLVRAQIDAKTVEVQKETVKAEGQTTSKIYYVIGFVVLVLIVGLYFIFRKK